MSPLLLCFLPCLTLAALETSKMQHNKPNQGVYLVPRTDIPAFPRGWHFTRMVSIYRKMPRFSQHLPWRFCMLSHQHNSQQLLCCCCCCCCFCCILNFCPAPSRKELHFTLSDLQKQVVPSQVSTLPPRYIPWVLSRSGDAACPRLLVHSHRVLPTCAFALLVTSRDHTLDNINKRTTSCLFIDFLLQLMSVYWGLPLYLLDTLWTLLSGQIILINWHPLALLSRQFQLIDSNRNQLFR